MASSFVAYVTFNLWSIWQMKKVKTNIITRNLNTNIRLDHLKFWIYYTNEFAIELLDNISIFYYDAHIGVNVLTLEPLLAGNK